MVERNNYKEIAILSYTAGIIDGEATLTIRKSVRGMGANKSYAFRLQMGITNRDVTEWLYNALGGRLGVMREETEKRKKVYLWVVDGYKAIKLLKKVRPCLIIKSAQADLAFEFYEKYMGKSKGRKNGRCKVPSWLVDRGEECYLKMKELNKTGPA